MRSGIVLQKNLTGTKLEQDRAPRLLSARWRLRAPLLLAVLGVAGCTAAPDLPPLPPTATGEYRLGPGDRIRIITFGEAQLTGEFRVSEDGNIAAPLLGNIHAAGLTTSQLESSVAGALTRAGLIKSPSVSIEVVATRPIFVLGEVAHPGEFPYQPGMTVLTAVAIAGGFTYRAAERRFSVVRNESGRAVEGAALRQTFLQPGDVLTVYERYF